jgi:site-specific DNA-methyltransferase (adenine-specific)
MSAAGRKRGTIYIGGAHMIEMFNEDFRQGHEKIKDGSVSILFLDLPYGSTRNKWDVVIPFRDVWQVAYRILKPNGVVIFTAAGYFTAQVIMSDTNMYKYSLVWQKTTKTNFLNTKRQFLRSHEDIVIFYDRQPTFNPVITTGHKRKVSTADHKRNSKQTTNYGDANKVDYDSTDRYSGSVLTFPNDKQKNSINPTQKPVKLLEQLFSVFSNEGDLIADLTAGSFSSAVAAKNLKRRFIGFENDKIQFDKAVKRVENA